MKVAIVTLLALCLVVLVLILWAITKNYDEGLSKIVSMLDTITSYKFDDLYLKLCAIRDNTWELIERQKKLGKETEKAEQPDPPDALIIEPCPICGYIPAMYKHTELGSYCVRCSGWSRSKYDGQCSCSICVVSDDKVAAITAWNDAVNDYIMHKNEED